MSDRKCIVCGNEGSPNDPVNCVVDDSEGNPAYVCFDATLCAERLADSLESSPLPVAKEGSCER